MEGTDDPAFLAATRHSLDEIASRGSMVRKINDPYYGDLRVYWMP